MQEMLEVENVDLQGKHEFDHRERSDGEDLEIDEAEARRIRRKVDFRLLPILILLYTLAFLDRVNIGNARLWGMEKDLHMKGNDFNVAVMIFYIPYILLGIPSNMILTRVGPRYWISGLTLGWGLSVTFVGFSKSYGPFLAVRVLLGVFEAGMFPACVYLINTWYSRHELATRMAWFMVANDIAGIASGLLGAGLGSLDGTGGYGGWSWIFFIEGGMTVVAGILAFFLILDFPEDSNFLNENEKRWLLRKLAADSSMAEPDTKMTLKGVMKALTDWKVLISGILYLACCNTAYAIAVFQPTILATFGWSSMKANLLSAPLRVLVAITVVAVGITSDKLRIRGPFIIVGFLLSIVGDFCIAFTKSTGTRYMGLWFAGLGIMGVQPTIIGWCAGQVSGASKRGTLTSFASSLGQLGGITSALAFPSSDAPAYVPGNMVNVALSLLGALCAMWLSGWSVWENRQREQGKRDHLRQLPQQQLDNLGEKHPDFRFSP